MRLTILILFLIISAGLRAQPCDAPEIIDWTATDDWIFEIVFFSPEGGFYELVFEREYAEETTINYSVDASPGVNSLEFNLEDLYFLNENVNHYIKCSIGPVDCDDGIPQYSVFYISSHSLISDESLACDSLVMPIQYVSDGSDFMVETILNYPQGDGIVEDIEVFVDIGHENNSDLSIELEHPSGQIISLLDYDTVAFGTTGFSVIFSDYASELPEDLNEYMGPRGTFLPAEPLSSFSGLPAQGDWILRVIDNAESNIGYVFGACLSIECETSYEGKTFFDLNSNGVQENSENDFPYALVENGINGNEYFANSAGEFFECTSSGDASLNILNEPNYFTSIPVNFSLEEGDQLNGLEILVQPEIEVVDFNVDIMSMSANRPGFEASYSAQVNNVGTICEEDVEVEIEFPEYVEIVSSADPDLIITDNTATITVEEVCPFNPIDFNLTILLDDTVSLGTILEATISTNVTPDDPNPSNNTFTSSVEVVGSYDPNDKQVSLEDIGDEFLEDGLPLKYTIRFQNTGTFYAERVVIADTIDTDLDINSLNIISTSHDMQLSREGNVLYFEFDQIFLPDSATDLEGSNGHVRYEMDPLPSFSEGETIENTAYIYFDFNEAIVTNTVVTSFQNPLRISEQPIFDAKLFPNPATKSIHLSWPNDVKVERIEIHDISGRLIQSQSIMTDNFTSLDVSSLTEGIYLIDLVAENAQSRQKFMKIAEQ